MKKNSWLVTYYGYDDFPDKPSSYWGIPIVGTPQLNDWVEFYGFVSWDDFPFPTEWKNKIHVPNHQPAKKMGSIFCR
jgi:hypothetical protein